MKKILFGFLFLGLVHLSHAAVFYVNDTGSNGNGTSWSTPWVGFSSIQWASVTNGSTICVAGGSYGSLNPGKAGVAGGRITIKRATAGDTACGPNIPSGADSLITLSGISFNGPNGSYVTIDGVVEYGMKISINDGGRGITFRGTVDYAELKYIEIAGPAQSTDYSPTAETRGLEIDGTGRANYLRLNHMSIHGMDNLIWWQYSNNATIEYCKLYNSVSSRDGRFHGNAIFNSNSDYGTYRYNEMYGITAEGIYFPYGGDTGWRIYGNIFRDATGTGRAIETRQKESGTTGDHGTFYVYNNIFARGLYPNFRSDAVVAGGEAYNNLLFNCPATWHSKMTNVDNISVPATSFVNAAGNDFRLVSGSPAIDAGTSITPDGYVEKDADGNTRGPAWDIGAYEFNGIVTNTLAISKTGTGAGTVTGSGINCGSDCTETYANPTNVTLTATPSGTNVFAGWSGSCSGLGACTVSVNGYKSVQASFSVPPPDVSNGTIINTSGGAIVFNLTEPGIYKIIGSVTGLNDSANSFFVDIDNSSTADSKIWDILPFTVGYQDREISWRGTGTYNSPQFAPQTFDLAAGLHTLYITDRPGEEATLIQSVKFVKTTAGAVAHPADTNGDFLMALNEATFYSSCWKKFPDISDGCPANALLDYAVRAGTLWNGTANGQYQYNSNQTCPLCWEVKP